jgi:hypothetical protein
MNGGHYLTKGHVIFCLLYIKESLMSRNILVPEKPFWGMQTAPCGKIDPPLRRLCFWMDHKRPFNAAGSRKRELFRFRCVLFDTKMAMVSGQFCPSHLPSPQTSSLLRRRRTRGSMDQNHKTYCLYLHFNDLVLLTGACGCSERLRESLGWYGDCRSRSETFFHPAEICTGAEKIGA